MAPSVSAARPATPSTPAPGRLGNGVVQRAVVAALLTSNRPMRLSEIHSAVEALLGQSVSIESVSWSLRVGCQRERPRFERERRGIYRLRNQT